MSPMPEPAQTLKVGFPRVSGDEPQSGAALAQHS